MAPPTPADIERLDRAPYARSLGARATGPDAGPICTNICSLTPGSLPDITRSICQ